MSSSIKIPINNTANAITSNNTGDTNTNWYATRRHMKSRSNAFRDVIKATSIDENIRQVGVETVFTYLPKLSSLVLLRSFGPTIVKQLSSAFPNTNILPPTDDIDDHDTSFNKVALLDESFLDFALEVPVGYFAIPFAFPLAARSLAKSFNIKDFRLIGIPMRELEDAFKNNTTIETGKYYNRDGSLKKSYNPQTHRITEKLLNKISRLKFLTVASTTLAMMAFVGVESHIRNLLTIKFCNESNPYVIQGMKFDRTAEDIDKQNQFVKDRSWDYIKKITAALILGLGGIAGLTHSIKNPKALRKVTKYLDGGKNFQFSRIMFALFIGSSLWAYPASGRPIYNDDNKYTNNPEWSEMLRRMIPVVGMALFGKDIMKGLTTKVYERHLNKKYNLPQNNKLELLTPFKEITKRNQFFDYNPVHYDRIANQISKTNKNYKINNKTKDLLINEKQEKSIINNLKFIEDKLIYGGILTLGLSVNFYNYLVTFHKNHAYNNNQSDDDNN